MAKVSLDWTKVKFPAREVSYFKDLKPYCQGDTYELLKSERAVYVIRTMRPFAFLYAKGQSPVAYIGKGEAQVRLRSHLGGWMRDLANTIPGLKLEISVCKPTVPYHGTICEDVEADLIQRFVKRYGEAPLRNRRKEWPVYSHTYRNDDVAILGCGKGGGYHWALRPMKTSSFHRATPTT